MSERTPKRRIIPGAGVFPGVVNQLKLILRLLLDRRVHPLLKVLPIGALIYWIVPFDLMPGLPFDDAAALYIGGALFIELSPQDVVQEHLAALRLEAQRAENVRQGVDPNRAGEVIDAEFRDVTGRESQPGNGPDARR